MRVGSTDRESAMSDGFLPFDAFERRFIGTTVLGLFAPLAWRRAAQTASESAADAIKAIVGDAVVREGRTGFWNRRRSCRECPDSPSAESPQRATRSITLEPRTVTSPRSVRRGT